MSTAKESPTIVHQASIEHCGASVSKQYTAILNCYVAKALPVKYQITAHRPWHVAKKKKFCHSTVCKSL